MQLVQGSKKCIQNVDWKISREETSWEDQNVPGKII
jgi:hypothetical protein